MEQTWATTKVIEKKICSCDQQMLRHMAHVGWEDRVTTEEVRRRCGVKDIMDVLKRNRLRWYVHVRRSDSDHVLSKAAEMEVKELGQGEDRTRHGSDGWNRI